MLSTIIPVVALDIVRGTAVNAVNKANCVAANAGLVVRAIKATQAAVPSPTPRYSKPITRPKSQSPSPTRASRANPRIETI